MPKALEITVCGVTGCVACEIVGRSLGWDGVVFVVCVSTGTESAMVAPGALLLTSSVQPQLPSKEPAIIIGKILCFRFQTVETQAFCLRQNQMH
eukprot:m.425229 g.425229  ORF g.425229 m.425229 type:complete len:94 (+) comp21343_c0_seq2:55-336(+)